jgi:hypothetical protein
MKSETLQQKIDRQRRIRKWEDVRRRLRLKFYEYEDAGKGQKAAELVQAITDRILRPCRKCGRH